MNKLIVIIGPTGAKKTTIAHLIAQQVNGEIINGDVFQMYKDVNAGINKPSLKQQQEIKYHLINTLNIFDRYSIYNYQNDFDSVYKEIIDNNKIPILCGGSHLYLDTIIRGYELTKEDEKYTAEIENWTDEQLIEYLTKYDPVSLQKNINNHHRLKRAVIYLKMHNNQPKAETEILNNNPNYNCLIIMAQRDRHDIYNFVDERVLEFINKNNWINEVKQLISKYGNEVVNSQAFKAIGYKEIYNHIVNNESLVVSKLQTKTRHLVKHQLTWCNHKFPNKISFDLTKDNIDELITKVRNFWYD